jgi:hypothetical protein
MRRNGILLAVAALLLLASALSAVALAAGEPDLSWWMIGGGPPVTVGDVALSGGVGQGVAGPMETGATALCSGFWCAPSGQRVHLPVVLK